MNKFFLEIDPVQMIEMTLARAVLSSTLRIGAIDQTRELKMDGTFYQSFFDLGLVSSRLAASKNYSEEVCVDEYEELKTILRTLNLDVPSPGECFDIKSWTDRFTPPNLKLKKSLFRMGRISFALFMLGKNVNPAGASEFLSLFDAIKIRKSIGKLFIKNLKEGDKRKAFKLFINQIIPEIECLDVPQIEPEDSESASTPEASSPPKAPASSPAVPPPQDSSSTSAIDDFRQEFKKLHFREWYFADIDNDLREINACLENKCYRASLSLARRMQEFTLKIYCSKKNVDITNVWNFDKLLDTVDLANLRLDATMMKLWHTINQERIIDASSESVVPPPGKSLAHMVCQSMLDTMQEVFLNKDSGVFLIKLSD